MTKTKKTIAFDLGASNGRGLLGQFDGRNLSIEVLTGFDNHFIRVNQHFHWDILALWNNIKASLAQAASAHAHEIASIGVDTWAVDFGLLDQNGELIGNPYCYRDPHKTGMMDKVFETVSKEQVFQTTGVQFMEQNTLYQLMALKEARSPGLEIAKTFQMIPDLIHFWLTGVKACEYTNATTTQFFNVRSRTWDYSLLERLGLPTHFLPPIVQAGAEIGLLQRSVQEETFLQDIPVIAVGTHDTASAVAAVPTTVKDFAYISSGTWALIGGEIPEPMMDEKVFRYNFGNEGGVYQTIRLLKDVVNMWLMQDCRRTWRSEGVALSWEDMAGLAGEAPAFGAFIDPDDPGFYVPKHMPTAIQAYCQNTGQKVPQTRGEILRTCLESLAFKYRYTIEELAELLGKKLEMIHIVGGGAHNELLCQFTANALNLPVVAGPFEATALGNIIVQMIADGDLANLAEGRDLIRRSFPAKTYLPEQVEAWEEQYHHYRKVCSLESIVQ